MLRASVLGSVLLSLAACGLRPTPSPATPAAALAPRAPGPVGFRLPRGDRPLAYRLILSVDPARDFILGDGEIDVERKAAGGALYLNAHELTIDSASVVGDPMPLTPTAVDGEMVALAPARPDGALPAGRVTLHLHWKARVHHEDTAGAFAQKTDSDWYAYTQFEAIGARRVFPCFDEPGFKVPWQLTVFVPRGLVAISNTPVRSRSDEGKVTRVVFEPTPPLPSYLMALAVGPFELLPAGRTAGGAPIQVAVPRGHAAEATIPVADTAPLLALLESYFGTPYPFAKLDLVPIPDTVGFGAMENPGMITYASPILLTKPDQRSFRSRRGYAYTAAHEMAHQWFGDLVTMAWWDDLWLNEAFASWMGDRIVHTWKPEWKTDISDVAGKDRVMELDSRDAARRIREPVVSENDVEDAFDGITYDKGKAVIAMIERWIGPDRFQKGVRAYLAQHARGNATYRDLVAALRAASTQDVRLVGDDFLDRPGVPFLSFTLVCNRGEKPRLELTQRRFVPFHSTIDPHRAWHVPVTVRWQAGQATGRASTVLAEPTGSLVLGDAPACPDWVLPNDRASGYYRWNLAGAPFERLRGPVVMRGLSPPERREVAAALFALVSSGELPYRRGLEMAMTLIDDPEPRVRQLALGAGAGWDDRLPREVVPRYRAWVRETFGPAARRAGFSPRPDEDDDEKSIRVQLLERLVYDGEDAATRKEVRRLTWKWLDDRSAIAPDMVRAVVQMAAHDGDRALYERFLAEARKAARTNDKPERERFLAALAGFRAPELVARTRQMVLQDEFPILEMSRFLWVGRDDRAGRERSWAFLVAHYDAIAARLPREARAGLIRLGGDCTAAGLERTRAFFAERTPRELSGPRTYKRFIENESLCIARRPRDTESFVAFLRDRSRSPVSLQGRAPHHRS
jgi:alanyl aminopeptidase